MLPSRSQKTRREEGKEDPKQQAVRMKRLVLALRVARFYIFGDRRYCILPFSSDLWGLDFEVLIYFLDGESWGIEVERLHNFIMQLRTLWRGNGDAVNYYPVTTALNQDCLSKNYHVWPLCHQDFIFIYFLIISLLLYFFK